MEFMNRMPFYGRGYFTPQMRTTQQSATTCKLPISAESEAMIRNALEREGKSIKSMLAEVLEQLANQSVTTWKTDRYSNDHTWTIATSKELMGEFKRRCEAARLDWRAVLSKAVMEYASENYAMSLNKSS